MNAPVTYVKQHLIDPVACIRCNACMDACSRFAIQFDGGNYIVDPVTCNACQDCVPGCPTGAVNHWHLVATDRTYSLEEQSTWSELPALEPMNAPPEPPLADAADHIQVSRAPWSAEQPQTMLFTPTEPVTATVITNIRLTDSHSETEIRQIVLDFGNVDFQGLEGQAIGILPPGKDALGRPHHMRAYSIASDRDGELPGRHTVAITVKRLIDTWSGQPYHGVGSNYLCDLRAGDSVRCVGPIGSAFLMPQHTGSRLLMICTGTGIAPMRAFLQRRQQTASTAPDLLFYGGRSMGEMAYLTQLKGLPNTQLDLRIALSREPDQPKQYVQDLLRTNANLIADLLQDDDCFIYICGLRGMEAGVIETFETIGRDHLGQTWTSLRNELLQKGRLHVETY